MVNADITKAEYLELASKHYDLINDLNKLDNFYDYEKGFISILHKMGKEILEKNLGTLSQDKRKKTLLTTMGKITINCSLSFSQKVNGFQMSSLLQNLVAYARQLNVYEKSNDILERFLSIEISTMQVNKVTDYYRSSCAKEEALWQVSLKPVKPKEVLYIEADSSMLFTRDNGWKEVKAGRLCSLSL